MAKSCKQALTEFLGPIMADFCALIDEGPDDMPVKISFGGYEYETTLADFKMLDKAHREAFERQMKAQERKTKTGFKF